MHTPSISRQVSGKRRVFALLLGLFLLISSTCAYSEGVSVSSRIDALLSAQQSAAGADSLQSWLNGALCKQAGSSAEFDEQIADLLRKVCHTTGVIPAYGQQLLTLSTCYGGGNGRLIVAAIKT